MSNRIVMVMCTGLMVLAMVSGAAAGEGSTKSFGVRAGLGINPDQFVAGAQTVMGRVMKHVYLAPSADIGFGDNVTVLTFNPDLRLPLSLPNSEAALYAQAGPTIAVIDPKYGDGDTEIGLTLSAGLEFPMGKKGYYSLEARIGIGDVPDARILLGILFGGRKATTSSNP